MYGPCKPQDEPTHCWGKERDNKIRVGLKKMNNYISITVLTWLVINTDVKSIVLHFFELTEVCNCDRLFKYDRGNA